MRGRALLLGAAVLLLAGCGGDSATTSAGTTTAPQTTTSGGEAMSLQAFFYRDAALVPVTVDVPRTEAVARAALDRLLEGPPPGYDTALPGGVRLVDVTISGGIATAVLSGALGTPTRTAQGQLVATLAQFTSVTSVRVEVEGGGPVELADGGGRVLDRPATADDYTDLTTEAPIFVAAPARDSTVSSPVRASGTADVFEATFQVEVWSGDRRVRTEVITATSGTGTRGTWETTLELPSGPARLVFFEASAEDGSHLHETEVLLNVR